ncbi:MAG TPA: glycoside hydrolase family 95 protein [Devosia sp.]|nr:glycoside hydrolase family 95 protein [Devosia sp.]
MNDLDLWYRAPAAEWTEALPIGNGRLGAMVFGGIEREHLQLNEDTLWTGGPYSPVNPEAKVHLDAVRQLIFAGQYAEAETLAEAHCMAIPIKQMAYQPAGDLWLDFSYPGAISNYRRALDLDAAIATTTLTAGGIGFTRQVLASPVDDVIVLRLTASQPGSLNFIMALTSEQPGALEPEATDTLSWHGHNRDAEGIQGRLSFTLRAKVIHHGGTLAASNTALKIAAADTVTILIDAATSFRRFDDVGGDPIAAVERRLAAAATRSFDAIQVAHSAEHQRLFRRLSINLGKTAAASLPTNERVAASQHVPDPALAALYVQFGRYLMLCSSRPGTQPSTLQGIWNKEIDPPWGSKYTANINLQMNYWLPDPANLAECVEPVIVMAEELMQTGAEMAKAHYGARGWVMHHNTDLWRAAGPVDGAKWGLWPTGGAWLCAQLWDHCQFSGDPALMARLYPIMAGAARFILDILQPLPGTGYVVTVPSLSPENVHPQSAALCAGPTMDNQIIRDLFDAVIAAADQLGADPALRAEVAAAREKLPPHRIGKAGQLQEWLEDWDMEVPEIHHRHVSHLYGLYPSRQIGVDNTPALAAAARKSLEIRGDDATGWGIGWRINLWARLRDGDHAHGVVGLLLGPERTYPNMFDAHPPFQIDGNFGGAAGILEMLVQSGDGTLHLLPALPAAWPAGSVTGIRARGGLTVDLHWAAGQLVTASLTASSARSIMVSCGDRSRSINVSPTPRVVTSAELA